MQPNDVLLVLAEVTTAFAGFSGVVAALGKDWNWDEKARFRFQNLLAISLVTIFLCLLPIVLSFYQIPRRLTFIAAGTLMVMFACGFIALRSPVAWRLTAQDPDDKAGRVVGFTFLITLPAVVLLLLLGAFSMVDLVASYVSGLFVYLVLSALQFGLLVSRATKGGS